jgi:Icc-related predicted phosphoesterase
MASRFRLAASADLHSRQDQHGRFRDFVKMVNGEAEGLVLCGDLTDRGLPEEAKTLAEALTALRVPCAAVLGNHDYEAGQVGEVVRILREADVQVLDGDHALFDKRLGIAGAKGFGCGFNAAMLQAFGEPSVKQFVQESVNEALKLEAALAQLDTQLKVVIMHYAPVPDTCRGENPEINPFLGSSRLAAPAEMFGAQAIFHGHAHHGVPQAQTPRGVPVYNVALPVLRKYFDDRRFRIVDIEPREEDHAAPPQWTASGAH